MIGPGTTVRGRISGDEDLQVEGTVDGSIHLSRSLHIGKDAKVSADVEATDVVVAGTLSGSVVASTGLVIDASATVQASIKTPRLSIAEGAQFTGKVEMDFEIEGVDTPRSRRR